MTLSGYGAGHDHMHYTARLPACAKEFLQGLCAQGSVLGLELVGGDGTHRH